MGGEGRWGGGGDRGQGRMMGVRASGKRKWKWDLKGKTSEKN